MIDINEYQELKQKSEQAKADVARAEGALEQQMSKLQEEFDCNTIEKAETLLKALETEEKKSENVYNKELEKFKEKWDDKL